MLSFLKSLVFIISVLCYGPIAQGDAPPPQPSATTAIETAPTSAPLATITPSPASAPSSTSPSSTASPKSVPSPSRAAELPRLHREPKRVFAIFEVTYDGKPLGKIKVKLYDRFAPKTVENFIQLAEGTKPFFLDDPDHPGRNKEFQKPFYDGLTFHRVIPGFMIQGGDPKGDGRGGPGYTIPDEFSPYVSHNKAGILAMANTGQPNTGGSQFYITITPQPRLDHIHTVFGEVIQGFEYVKAISKVPRHPGVDRPKKPVVIKKVTIIRET